MEEMIVNVPFKITEEFMSDVICTAFEGGSNYWIEDVRNLSKEPKAIHFSESFAKGDELEILAYDDDVEYTLTHKKFLKGYKLYVKHCTEKHLPVYTDPCDIDSDVADMILQFALFNELVYG